MKLGLIRQPAGIGDIFFTQKIAKLLLSKKRCNKILWPVISQYNYIDQYIKADGIEYIDENENFKYKDIYLSPINQLYEQDDLIYIPLQHADQTVTLPDSRAHGHIKYKFCNNLDYSDWKQYLNLYRNHDRENKLVNKLKINLNSNYNLINSNYASPPDTKSRKDIKPNNNFQNIYMDFLENIHIFDWLKIAENAQEIHTMETSLCFLLEKINLNNVFVYSKYTVDNKKDDFGYIKDNYSKDWKYMH
jgi:hypothetical protein